MCGNHHLVGLDCCVSELGKGRHVLNNTSFLNNAQNTGKKQTQNAENSYPGHSHVSVLENTVYLN